MRLAQLLDQNRDKQRWTEEMLIELLVIDLSALHSPIPPPSLLSKLFNVMPLPQHLQLLHFRAVYAVFPSSFAAVLDSQVSGVL